MAVAEEVAYRDVVETAERIAPYIHRTAVQTSRSLDARADAVVHVKCENFQRAGSFKSRGAMHHLSRMDADQRARGVVTHSSGNHAQALALAGRTFDTAVHVVMPRTAPQVKRDATAGYGAHIMLCEPEVAAREAACDRIQAETGATMVHPYDHPYTIMGQGTAALELLDDVGDLDTLLVPVSGGGLLSGCALVAAERGVRVIGCEPALADDAWESMQAGRLIQKPAGDTMADGLRAELCDRTFAIIQRYVDSIVRVSEEQMLEAMYFVWERMKIICEPSCAVAVAPLFFERGAIPGRRIGILLSGGNVDVQHFGR